ncbi:lysyl oxidase homolog 2-like [Limulus polyphemus]|uniref:protein-lysine 6-oxidase n=1 Tax=Limulus polyphemus TaxID=6850 RepID=A0ABM1BEC2_LIMPO|nr:lysyl oxidase homolog 2-like [Limulus polyphemus]
MTNWSASTILSRAILLIAVFIVLMNLLSIAEGKKVIRSSRRRLPWIRSRRSTPHRSTREIHEGSIRLVGGHTVNQGNVEIYHLGEWGSICDDEWDEREANVVCRQLGYPAAKKPTTDSFYGQARSTIWMDNIFCNGNEMSIEKCPFDGWGITDCIGKEAAGVICQDGHLSSAESSANYFYNQAPTKYFPRKLDPNNFSIRLAGGLSLSEGRVEVYVPDIGWGTVCGDGWEILEANVICKQLGLGYAQEALQNSIFGGQQHKMILSGVKCTGNEKTLAYCQYDSVGNVDCPGRDRNIAGVICVKAMSDLIPDEKEIERSAYLDKKQLFQLQCAMEENCVASSAYRLLKENRDANIFETRKLLRFTARIGNIGTADFLPFLAKRSWQWHACHKHYHSMEVFAHFDVIDARGNKIAEGHKASFCLEDNFCRAGSQKKYVCANYGDQGITVGCTDNYMHDIDCQWVDITDIKPGNYYFKVSINPEFKVAEMTFDNNAALCNLDYTSASAKVWNCTLTRP